MREIAELVQAVKTEMLHIDKDKDNPGDESTVALLTEIGGKEELLDGEVIASRPFGFTTQTHFHKPHEVCNEWCHGNRHT